MHTQRQRGGKLSPGAQVDGRHGDDTKAFAGILIGPGHPESFLQPQTIIFLALATPGVLTLALATPSVLYLGLGHVLATPKSLGCSLKHAWPPHFGSPSLL